MNAMNMNSMLFRASAVLPTPRSLRACRQKGQGVTEYIVVLLLVAIVSILIITSAGQSVKTMWSKTSDQLKEASTTTIASPKGE